jgi:Mrp family chromosome partitioning ATPase
MSQVEVTKSRIIELSLAPRSITPHMEMLGDGRSASNGRDRAPSNGYDRSPSNGYDRSPSNGHDRSPSNGNERNNNVALRAPTTVVVEPASAQPEAATFEWTSPVVIVEEVASLERPDPRLCMLLAPSSTQARSYRLLQHRLLAKNDPRVVVVSGAEAGAGKTTCAANLALALSEAALSRVLLVDANLARPALGELFDFVPSDSFMIKLLRSEDCSLPLPVASIAGLNLQLAALEPSVSVGKRLDRALFAQAIQALRASYDYIVIDAASTSESADVNDIAECCDGVVLVARSGQTRIDALQRSVAELQPANVLGTVLLDS